MRGAEQEIDKWPFNLFIEFQINLEMMGWKEKKSFKGDVVDIGDIQP